MTDIVDRLRACAFDPMWASHAEAPKSLFRAAADEVERQQNNSDNLRQQVEDLSAEVERLTTLHAEQARMIETAWSDAQHDRAEVEALRAEVERQQQSIVEMGEKLRGIVNLIRGEPPEDESHSTHDAVDLVRDLVMHNDLYAKAVEHETSALRDSCEAKADRIDRLGERVEKDTALMRRALEALEQVAAQPVGLRGYSSRAFVIAELRERVGAAIGEQK